MSALGGWVLSIAAIVLVGTVVDLLMTKSRLKNFIRSVFATITVLVIITPVPGFIKSGFSADFSFDDIQLDSGYIDYANNYKLKVIALSVEAALTQDGVNGAVVTIEGEADKNIEIKSVTINLKNSVIAENLQHINKYELVKSLVGDYLSISEDLISVYE